jgi:hypothetical protein
MEKVGKQNTLSNFPTATTTTNHNQLWDTDPEGKVSMPRRNTRFVASIVALSAALTLRSLALSVSRYGFFWSISAGLWRAECAVASTRNQDMLSRTLIPRKKPVLPPTARNRLLSLEISLVRRRNRRGKQNGEAHQARLQHHSDRAGPFAFAGIWDAWKRPDGTYLETFALVTTEPNELVAQIHDRPHSGLASTPGYRRSALPQDVASRCSAPASTW